VPGDRRGKDPKSIRQCLNMENKNITIRPVKENEIDKAVALMNSQYARKKNVEYFRWQYFDSYFPSVLMGAFDRDELVGIFGLQKKRLNNDTNIGQLIDLLITPDWRKQGLFVRLAEEVYKYFEDLKIFCVLPNLNGKNACEKSLGFKTIAKIDSMVLKNQSLDNDNSSDRSTGDIKQSSLIAFEKNDEYRKWRFDKNPEYKYDRTTGSNSAFAITKIFKDPVTGDRYGDIVEYDCVNTDLLSDLFHKTTKELFKTDIKNITTWALPHTDIFQILKKIGFVESPQERYFCIKIFYENLEKFDNINNWHLIPSDAEIY
jgi:GNAT superfamily N-acetyltransferase